MTTRRIRPIKREPHLVTERLDFIEHVANAMTADVLTEEQRARLQTLGARLAALGSREVILATIIDIDGRLSVVQE